VGNLAEMKIDIRVKQSKRKSLKMTILSDGSVCIDAPETMSKEKIMKFVEDKKSWIVSKVNQRLSAGRCYNTPVGEQGEKFSYLGRECKLSIEVGQETSVAVKNGYLIVKHTNNQPDEILQVIESFFRNRTREEVDFWIKYYQPQFNQSPNRVVIKEQKKRWGSCSSKMNLNFNWRLSMLPTWVLSYIVLHELCHFEEMNHSEEFWKAVENRMPEYPKARLWLSLFT
jgi:predicted metal-dependent hydrolase